MRAAEVWNFGDELQIVREAHSGESPFTGSVITPFGARLLCTGGYCDGTLDGVPFRLTPGTMLRAMPGQHLAAGPARAGFTFTAVLFSEDFLLRLRSLTPGPPQPRAFTRTSPASELPPREADAFSLYLDACVNTIRDTRNPHRLHLLLLYTYAQSLCAAPAAETVPPGESPSRAAGIVTDFSECLQQHYRRHRDVAWYAGQLNITPKYLSEVVQKQSGHPASWWINRLVTDNARHALRFTADSIQTIASGLGFEDPSAFCKYFKRQTGRSPRQYRERDA